MTPNRQSALWYLVLIGAAAVQIVDLPPIPRWLNNAVFLTSLIVMVVAAGVLCILQRQHHPIVQPPAIFDYDMSRWLTRIVDHRYLILIVSAVLAFTIGAVVFPTNVDELVDHMPTSIGIEKPTKAQKTIDDMVLRQTPDRDGRGKKTDPLTTDEKPTISPVGLERLSPSLRDPADTPYKPPTRVFTPRTPKELMDSVSEKTTRDAMRHVGAWIRVAGPVLDISEVRGPSFGITKPYIVVEVIAGSRPDNAFPQTVKLHVDAATWRPQVDRIEREDWLVAIGTVRDIHKLTMSVINGELISVSGSGENKR